MPPLPGGPRGALRDLADRLAELPLTLVVAPAGGGKSTLLAAWRRSLATTGRPVAAVELSALHDDAGILAADWIDALDAASPGGFEASRRVAAQLPDAERGFAALARALIRDLSLPGPPIVSFFDGFENLAPEGSAAKLVDELLRAAPARLRLVIASRGPMPRAAARLRVEARLLEVGSEELALRADSVADVLRGSGVEPDEELVTAVLAQTEGWPSGVAMAARLLSEVAPAERHHHVSDLARRPDLLAYLSDEVLRTEDPETIAALEALAILGRATSEEVSELLGAKEDGGALRRASERGLAQLEDGLLRLPRAWESVLRERMRAHLDPSARAALERRAADIHARAGRLEAAMDLLLEAEDFEGAAVLVQRIALHLLGTGRRRRVREWLERIPQAIREREPALGYVHGLALVGLDGTRATQFLEAAGRAFAARGDRRRESEAMGALAFVYLGEGRMEDFFKLSRERLSLRRILVDPRQRGSLLVGLAGRATLSGRYRRALRLADAAARSPLPLTSRWLNALNRALMRILAGERERARGVLEEAMRDPELSRYVLPNATVRVLYALAVANARGADVVARAIEDAEDAFATMRELALDRSRMPSGVALSIALLAAGRTERAREVLRETLELCQRVGQRPLEAVARSTLAAASLRLGDGAAAAAEALTAVRLFEELLRERSAVLAFVFFRALWVLARTGDAPGAYALLQRHGARLSEVELPLLAHTVLLARADICRLAGREGEARIAAVEGWRRSARASLDDVDPEIGLELAIATAPMAIAAADVADHVVDRLRDLAPRELPRVLEDAIASEDIALRRAAVAQMGRLGDRRHHAALQAVAKGDADASLRKAAVEALARLDPRPRYVLHLSTLGGFRAFRGAEEVEEKEWRGQTSRRLLLRLLASGGEAVPRARLLEDLWPDADPELARNHLRVATSRLHDALEPDRPEGVPPWFVRSEGEGLVVARDSGLSWDAETWEARVAEAAAAGDEERLRRLFDEGAGRLAPELEDEPWLVALRVRFAERRRALGLSLCERLLGSGRFDACDALANELLASDPADERAWAARMRARMGRGERAGALRIFREAGAALRQAVDAEPGPELRELADEARRASR